MGESLGPRVYGAIEAPANPADVRISKHPEYAAIAAFVPGPSGQVKTPMPPVADQGANPWCVAVSDAQGIKDFQEHIQLGKWLYDIRSSSDVYFGTQAMFHYAPGIDGLTSYDAAEYLRLKGVLGVNGNRYLIGSHYSLMGEADKVLAVQQAIGVLNRPVTVAVPWYYNWEYPSGNVLPKPGQLAGYHQVFIFRWVTLPDGRLLLCLRNSWSEAWGQNGNIYIEAPVLADLAGDLRVYIDR